MIYFFMDMFNVDLIILGSEIVVNVIRFGKVVIFINLFLIEFEIVFCVFNEIMYLMIIFLFDKFFRNLEIGRLKEIMGFIVDNGFLEVFVSFFV